MSIKKYMNLLTMCKKAGKLEIGFDSCKDAVKSGKAKLLIIASDASPKTVKEVEFFIKQSKKVIPAIHIKMNREEFFRFFRRKVAVMAVCDEGFAKAIYKIYLNDKNSDI